MDKNCAETSPKCPKFTKIRKNVLTAGASPRTRLGVGGYYPRENFILDARMCILEHTQRRIGIVMIRIKRSAIAKIPQNGEGN